MFSLCTNFLRLELEEVEQGHKPLFKFIISLENTQHRESSLKAGLIFVTEINVCE